MFKSAHAGCLAVMKQLVKVDGVDINLRNSVGLNCLQISIIGGHADLAKWLIGEGVDVTSRDTQGWTALHDASLQDQFDIAVDLLSKGADVFAVTSSGELPVDLADFDSPIFKLLTAQMEDLIEFPGNRKRASSNQFTSKLMGAYS